MRIVSACAVAVAAFSPSVALAADGSPYNVEQMAAAGVVVGLMALFVAWLVRRHTKNDD